jgi:hypothetical protein
VRPIPHAVVFVQFDFDPFHDLPLIEHVTLPQESVIILQRAQGFL